MTVETRATDAIAFAIILTAVVACSSEHRAPNAQLATKEPAPHVLVASASAPSVSPTVPHHAESAPPPPASARPEVISCATGMPEQSCSMDCASELFSCAMPCYEKCQKCDGSCDSAYAACHDKCRIDEACDAKCTAAKAACSAPCYRAKDRCLTGDCGRKMAAGEKRDAAERKAKFSCRGSVGDAVDLYLTCKKACVSDDDACRARCTKSTASKTGCSGSFYARAEWGFSVYEIRAMDGIDGGAD